MEYSSWKENSKIKLMIIVGTHQEFIRLAAVIKKARRYFYTILVHTEQNYYYNLNRIFFRDLLGLLIRNYTCTQSEMTLTRLWATSLTIVIKLW